MATATRSASFFTTPGRSDAFETPAWRAVLPELVPKKELPAASALNGIEFNLARATGPALAGALIAIAGVGAAFLVNVFSFIGVPFPAASQGHLPLFADLFIGQL